MVLRGAPGMAQQGDSLRKAGKTSHDFARVCQTRLEIRLRLVNGSTNSASHSAEQARPLSIAGQNLFNSRYAEYLPDFIYAQPTTGVERGIYGSTGRSF